MATKTTKKPVNRIAGNGKVAAKKPAAKKKDAAPVLMAPRIERVKYTLQSTNSLIVHQFDKKTMQQMVEKQRKATPQPKEARDTEAEYLASLYVLPGCKAGTKGCKYGFPASGFKQAMMTAAGRFLMDGRKMNGKIVSGSIVVLDDGGGLVQLSHPATEPHCREDIVRLQNRTAMVRFRGEFSQWSCDLRLMVNTAILSQDQVATLLQWAGFGVGLGEWRPDKGGSYGTFELK